MDVAVEDLFADFSRQPQSPGVTSLLRHCIGDDDCCGGEVTSFNAADNGPPAGTRQETVGAYSQLAAMCEADSVAQPAYLHHMAGQSGASVDAGVMLAPSLAPGFSLGTNFPAIVPANTGCSGLLVVARRRGRKPKPRLPDLQQQLDNLNEQFEQLSKENIFLRNKLKVLERVVPYRDESVGFLTQILSSAPTAAAAATAHAPERAFAHFDAAAAAAAGSAGPLVVTQRNPKREQSPSVSGDTTDSYSTGSGSGLSVPTPGTSGEAQSSHAPANSGGRGGAAGSEGSGRRCSSHADAAAAGIAAFTSLTASGGSAGRSRFLPACSQQPQRSGQAAGAAGTPAVLALCPSPDGEVPPITLAALEELKRVTATEFRMLWKHICLQLGVLVTGAEVHGPGSSPYVRLERFLERALSYMDKITLLSPTCFVHSMYTNVETGQPERPSDNFWITCARSLQLSPQQLREVTSLAAVYEQNIVPVVQQRLQLATQLSARLAAATAAQRGGSGGSSSDALAVLSSVDELAEQLERNALKEHQTHWNIGDFLCSSVLTPLQVARALSVCYPYIPDGIAMLHAFKHISAQDEAQAAATAAAAAQRGAAAAAAAPSSAGPQPQPQAGASNPQSFPSLAGLLASQLPTLAMGMAASGAGQAPQGGANAATAAALQQLAGVGGVGGGGMAALAGLAKLAGGLPAAQMQQALAGVLGMHSQQQQQQQVAQLQPLLAGLQAAAMAARTPPPPSLATAPPPAAPVPNGLPPAATAAQLQGFAALLGALASAQQATGARSGAQATAGLPGGPR